MKKTTIVNIYNFIRMSHVEPSIFIPDDFETVRNQITLIRQYGFPATYALKYDALMEPRYQELLKSYTGEEDEISAWWEITEPLCRKAGVAFRGGVQSEEYDERVNSAYSIGYTPEERRKLVDAYMDDFYHVFGYYPGTIGSWVLDTVTIAHAAKEYGILGSAICRDQMGTDGFTLWGGYPNGIYYPSRSNENLPGSTPEGQLPVPMFRLLGPDPIYNFEQDVRPGLHGVYTLEPSWLIGRSPEWISWFFGCLTQEDTLGAGYAHVGQENNFLWENIKPGLEPQLKKLRELQEEAEIRIETMAESAAWFGRTYRLTPPMSFQASRDWDQERNLSAQWYACANYRLGFLGEQGHLRIRDFFLYRQEYPSRYLNAPMDNAKSTFDALPVLFPQAWIRANGRRPFIRLLDESGNEPCGSICYKTLDELSAQAILYTPQAVSCTPQTMPCGEKDGHILACFTLSPDRLTLEGGCRLYFDTLPVFQSCEKGRISMRHEGFDYNFEVEKGRITRAGKDGVELYPEEGKICLKLGKQIEKETIFVNPEEKEICLKLGMQIEKETFWAEVTDKFAGKETGSKGNYSMKTPTAKTAVSSNGEQKNPARPAAAVRTSFPVPPKAPVIEPESCIFPAGSTGQVQIFAEKKGEIHYTLDGTEPTLNAPLYTRPIELRSDTLIRARLFLPGQEMSEIVSSEYRFGIQGIRLTSNTRFDPRPVFRGNGIADFLEPRRGSLDYLDGRWRGTLENLEICGQLPGLMPVEQITVGFLSHHRSGIIYPESLKLYTGPDPEHLELTSELALPCQPCAREIARQDFSLPVGKEIGAFRFIACRYAKMPQWCCYKGSPGVFTMADNIIVSPAFGSSL